MHEGWVKRSQAQLFAMCIMHFQFPEVNFVIPSSTEGGWEVQLHWQTPPRVICDTQREEKKFNKTVAHRSETDM